MNAQELQAQELGWLSILFSYFDKGLVAHNHFFRTTVDNWGMYARGTDFLTRTGGPQFYNSPHSKDKRLLQLDFVSAEALKIIQSNEVQKKKLIVDHAVPIKVLDKIVRERAPQSEAELAQVLQRFYKLGVITYVENDLIDKEGWQYSMPEGWSPETSDVFARYTSANVVRADRL